jgi:hypothetical protein
MQQSQAISLHSWSYLLLARVASEQGDDTGARRDLQNGIVFDRQNGLRAMEANKLFALAYIEGRTGDFAHCIADVQSSLTIEASAQNIMVASAVLGLAHTDAPEPYASLLRKRILGLKQLFPPESFGTISELARLRVRGEILLASGDAKGALAVFRKASDLDASAYGREYLARALDLMAQEKSESKNAMDLRRSAMNAYAATALRPNLLWFDSVDALPGYYAGQLISYLRLAKDTPMSTDQVTFAVQGLKDLRRTANHPPLETRINPNSN